MRIEERATVNLRQVADVRRGLERHAAFMRRRRRFVVTLLVPTGVVRSYGHRPLGVTMGVVAG